ncbi:hypothetical protein M422DRAFT_239458 [Sphaerobolus stellatus SS14]|nr:hypothetical protein M422DRAFT_239458 [Sphaerobolus stellatus SS14]
MGSPHLKLLDSILRKKEVFTSIPQPKFLDIHPLHKSGIVPHEPEFIGLTSDQYEKMCQELAIRVKEEADEMDGETSENDNLFIYATPLSGDLVEEYDPEVTLPAPAISISGCQKCRYEEESTSSKKACIEEVLNDADIGALVQQTMVMKSVPSAQTITQFTMELEPENELRVHTSTAVSAVPQTLSMKPAELLFFIFVKKHAVELMPLDSRAIFASGFSSANLLVASTQATDPAFGGKIQQPFQQLQPQKESRTVMAFTNLSGASATSVIDATSLKSSSAYFRFAGLCLQHCWHSDMSTTQWIQAASIYNDPAAVVEQKYLTKALPMDPITQNGVTLKKHCKDFEASLGHWNAELKAGSRDFDWKRLQLSFLPSELIYYSKLTLTGKKAKIGWCHRCNAFIDRQDHGFNHPKYCCEEDKFPHWELFPFPLPSSDDLVAKRAADGKLGRSLIPKKCVEVFREVIATECAGVQLTERQQNLLSLEVMAHKLGKERNEALEEGKTAYNFSEECFRDSHKGKGKFK